METKFIKKEINECNKPYKNLKEFISSIERIEGVT